MSCFALWVDALRMLSCTIGWPERCTLHSRALSDLFCSKIYSWGQQRGLTGARISLAIKGHFRVIFRFPPFLRYISCRVLHLELNGVWDRSVVPIRDGGVVKWKPSLFSIKRLLSFRTCPQLRGKPFSHKTNDVLCFTARAGFIFMTNSCCSSAAILQINWPIVFRSILCISFVSACVCVVFVCACVIQVEEALEGVKNATNEQDLANRFKEFGKEMVKLNYVAARRQQVTGTSL